MNQVHGPQTRANFEKRLWEQHSIARGITFESLGYDGQDFDHPTAVADLLDRRPAQEREHQVNIADDAGAYRKARILRGAIAWGGRALIDGLFADIVTLRTMKRGTRTAAVVAESEILSLLPKGFAHLYTAQFAQQLLAVTVEMTTRMADKWNGPSCMAQEFALHLLVKKIEDLVQEYDLGVDDDWSGTIYQGLMWDNDFMVLYGTARPFANTTDDWFEPFSGDTAVPPYAHFAPNDGPRAPEHAECAPGEGLGADRIQNAGEGLLVDIQEEAAAAGFSNEAMDEVPEARMMVSAKALKALCGRHSLRGPEASAVLIGALREAAAAAADEPVSRRVVFDAVPADAGVVPASVRLVMSVDDVTGYGDIGCLTVELASPSRS